MESLILPSQLQVRRRGLLGLLNEAMQQDHPASRVDLKQHPSDPVPSQTRSYFVKSIAQRSTDRHSNRPTEFHGFDVYADLLPILDWAERSQPLAYRLSASTSPEKDYLYFFPGRGLGRAAHVTLSVIVPHTVHSSIAPKL
jgi:hypothetical protein